MPMLASFFFQSFERGESVLSGILSAERQDSLNGDVRD